jgi:hypothetical protein
MIPTDSNGQPCQHNVLYRLVHGDTVIIARFRQDCDYGPIFVDRHGRPWRIGRDVTIEWIDEKQRDHDHRAYQ